MRYVFIFAQKVIDDVDLTRGRVIDVDLTINEARVRLSDDSTLCISLEPQDATEALYAVVRHGGSAVWIECDTDSRHKCVQLLLAVNENELDRELNEGCFMAEEHMVNLARSCWRESRVATNSCVSPESMVSKSATDMPEYWNPDLPLFPHQKQTLEWMREFEARVPATITYTGNLKITDRWFMDTEEECFTLFASPREAHLTGGLCADGTGSGKTATLLHLIVTGLSSTPLFGNNTAYISGATLIVLPLNLVSQWQHEMRKFLNIEKLKVVTILGKEIRSLSMQDLLNADIVLTTFHFLRSSKTYQEIIDAAMTGRGRTRAGLAAWSRNPNHVEPILEAVSWKRLVVDEIHETFESPRDLRHLRLMQRRVLWGMTATPILDTDAAQHLYVLLGREKAHHPNLLARVIECGICNHPIAAACTSVPCPTRSLQRVHLSAEERSTLRIDGDTGALDDMVQRCTMGRASEASLRSTEALRESSRLKLDALERAVRVLAAASLELERELERLVELCAQGDGDALRSVSHAQKACESQARDLALARQQRDLETRKLERFEASEAQRLERLVSLRTHGTKLEEIGTLLASLRESAILFVQWKSMVAGMRSFLRSLSLRVFTLDGNAAQRANTLNEFMSSGVLLLCLEDCFAGLHLPHVRCVIFAHAIVADARQVELLERQAIARCARLGQTETVQVHSFVVAESGEEELWLRTHKTSS